MKHLLFCVTPGIAFLLFCPDGYWTWASTSPMSVHQSRGVQGATPQQLSRAVTLFATDDDGPDAERLFLEVIRRSSVTTTDGETARYYLGRLYHRNHYMLGQRGALNRAVDRYKEIHTRMEGLGRSSAWYAEARFYKSLAYLELGKWKDAYEAVDHIQPRLDSELEIDYLVWSLRKRPINRRVPTATFKDRYLTLLKARSPVRGRDGVNPSTRDAVISGLQEMLERWASVRP